VIKVTPSISSTFSFTFFRIDKSISTLAFSNSELYQLLVLSTVATTTTSAFEVPNAVQIIFYD
jgi:hypothetical protein